MSEQKYYVFQKSLDGKKIVSQLVRCKFMSENAEFVPVIQTESGRYENSFSEFTKIDLENIRLGVLLKIDRVKTFDVDLLSSSIDEIERVLIGNKSDEVNAVYLKNAIRFIKTYINGIEENKEWINPLIELVPVEEE